MQRFITRFARALVVSSAVASFNNVPTLAEEVHYDVFVTSSGTGSQLVIGGYDDGSNTASIPVDQMRVFGGHVIGTGTTNPFESEAPGEPGFRAGTQAFLSGTNTTPSGVYTAFGGNQGLSFNFQPITVGDSTRNLLFWNGAGAVDFIPVGSNVVLGLTKPGGTGWTASINGATAGVAAGNTIQNTSSGPTTTGQVHTHLFTSISADGAAPDQGFYLFALQLGMAGYTSSDPIYFVYGAYDPGALAPQFADLAAFEAAHGLAEGWVETNLVAPVPEPSAVALAGIGLAAVGATALRRRARLSRKTG
jgi:hypothetical protein